MPRASRIRDSDCNQTSLAIQALSRWITGSSQINWPTADSCALESLDELRVEVLVEGQTHAAASHRRIASGMAKSVPMMKYAGSAIC